MSNSKSIFFCLSSFCFLFVGTGLSAQAQVSNLFQVGNACKITQNQRHLYANELISLQKRLLVAEISYLYSRWNQSARRIVSAELRHTILHGRCYQRNGGNEICVQKSVSGMERKKSACRTAPADLEQRIRHGERSFPKMRHTIPHGERTIHHMEIIQSRVAEKLIGNSGLMSKAKLKKYLSSLTKEQVIEVVLELYDARKEAKEYFCFIHTQH